MDLITPLLPESARPYAKAVLALLVALLASASTLFADQEWITVVVTLLGAAGVYAQPNAPIPDGTGKRRRVES